jgi:peroxiredoxin (alkyl hydroperoxide reductase subunit C)
MVAVGEAAPAFDGRDQNGAPLSVGIAGSAASSLARPPVGGAVLLVFFPWAFTSTCSGEMRALRDSLAVFSERSVGVIGVSCDAMFSQRVWADTEALGFQLVSDHWPHGHIARLYGVFDETAGVALRGSFLVDAEGIVRWSLVRGIGEERTMAEYVAALGLVS